MKKNIALMGFLLASVVRGSEVEWSRLKGTIRQVNYKTSTISIQDESGDLFKLKIDGDVTIQMGKQDKALKDVKLDDKVTLIYSPKAPTPVDADQPVNGTYK